MSGRPACDLSDVQLTVATYEEPPGGAVLPQKPCAPVTRWRCFVTKVFPSLSFWICHKWT